MELSNQKLKERIGKTQCKFFKKGICRNGYKCPYVHKKGKIQQNEAKDIQKDKQLINPLEANLDSKISNSNQINLEQILANNIAPLQQQLKCFSNQILSFKSWRSV